MIDGLGIVSASLGKVWFVGAGLGDPDGLTVKAWRLLQSATVVVADDLVSDEVLGLLPEGCECIWAGKRGGRQSTPQMEINALMVERCRRGQEVIRLKSGDPGVFGRLVQEVRSLQAANCNYELVPGLSSAIVGPTQVGIPLTDRELSSVFAVVTAHDCDRLPWSALAELDVVVFLMGTRSLRQICERLILAGKPAQTAIALIREAGRPQQQIWLGALDTFTEQMAEVKQQVGALSPAVIVVGETVALQAELQMNRQVNGGLAIE